MEPINIKMEFISMEILEESFPEDTINAAFVEGKYTWRFGMNFGVNRISKDTHEVQFKISYLMVELENTDNIILNLLTHVVINAMGEYSENGKLELIKKFFSICLWNTRGVFAAKVENTGYANVLPIEISPDSYDKQIINKLKDEWN